VARTEAQLRTVPVGDMNDVASLVASSAEAWLAEAGQLEPDLARLARELKHAEKRHVGLLPVGREVPIPGVARDLGQALALLLQRVVLVLDPERRSVGGGEQGTGRSATEAAVVAPGVVALAPFQIAAPGAKFESLKALAQFADREPELWGLALHDLSGCTRPGEFLGAIDVLDSVVLVGKVGHTTDGAVRQAARSLPPGASLGVLLVD
jgi:hypothetical protein